MIINDMNYALVVNARKLNSIRKGRFNYGKLIYSTIRSIDDLFVFYFYFIFYFLLKEAKMSEFLEQFINIFFVFFF